MGKADTHLHTEYSGFNKLGVLKFPESTTMPERQVDRMRQLGMDVMAITDHDEIAGAFIAQKYAKANFNDIEVIVGEEITTADGEVIGLFLTEKIPDMLPVEETIDIIRSQGGLAIAPHPFSMHAPGLQERILDLDIDGFETINGGHPDTYSNMFARLVMDRYPGRWSEMSGSDAHSVYTSGYNWTEFSGTSADDFRRAVLNKSTVAVGKPAPVFGQVQWPHVRHAADVVHRHGSEHFLSEEERERHDSRDSRPPLRGGHDHQGGRRPRRPWRRG